MLLAKKTWLYIIYGHTIFVYSRKYTRFTRSEMEVSTS